MKTNKLLAASAVFALALLVQVSDGRAQTGGGIGGDASGGMGLGRDDDGGAGTGLGTGNDGMRGGAGSGLGTERDGLGNDGAAEIPPRNDSDSLDPNGMRQGDDGIGTDGTPRSPGADIEKPGSGAGTGTRPGSGGNSSSGGESRRDIWTFSVVG